MTELETALAAAAGDEAARPRFYETLLKSQVLIVPAGETPAIVDGVVPEESSISLGVIELDGVQHVPFYSDESRLEPGTQFLRLAARDLLEMTRGAYLVLNPGSEHGKAFVPEEVASLLDGTIFQPQSTFVAPAGTQQLIGQPKDYPHAFAAALARLLVNEPEVERAYIAQHFIAGVHTDSTLLVAVVAPQLGFERISGAIGIVARDTVPRSAPVDVMRIDSEAQGYFSDQKPVYERRKPGFLAKLFGAPSP
jgi:hypothetical protein